MTRRSFTSSSPITSTSVPAELWQEAWGNFTKTFQSPSPNGDRSLEQSVQDISHQQQVKLEAFLAGRPLTDEALNAFYDYLEYECECNFKEADQRASVACLQAMETLETIYSIVSSQDEELALAEQGFAAFFASLPLTAGILERFFYNRSLLIQPLEAKIGEGAWVEAYIQDRETPEQTMQRQQLAEQYDYATFNSEGSVTYWRAKNAEWFGTDNDTEE